jgi:hypothetical protein
LFSKFSLVLRLVSAVCLQEISDEEQNSAQTCRVQFERLAPEGVTVIEPDLATVKIEVEDEVENSYTSNQQESISYNCDNSSPFFDPHSVKREELADSENDARSAVLHDDYLHMNSEQSDQYHAAVKYASETPRVVKKKDDFGKRVRKARLLLLHMLHVHCIY